MVELNSKHRTNRKERKQRQLKERKATKTSFPREQVEKADRDKPVLNKIMTTRNQRVKYNFVATLKLFIISNFSNIFPFGLLLIAFQNLSFKRDILFVNETKCSLLHLDI